MDILLKEVIEVNLLLIGGLITHIEIALKKQNNTYYTINRWSPPSENFSWRKPQTLEMAYHTVTFNIQADPKDILTTWKKFYKETEKEAFILGHNCAVSAQWFLTEFCNIPAPSALSLPITYDQALSFIYMPSFIPLPGSDRCLVLPCRIASNAEFYINARKNPQLYTQYTNLFLNTCLVFWSLTIAASLFGITLASMFLTGGLAIGLITGCALAGAASSYGFFSHLNTRSAKTYIESLSVNNSETTPLHGCPINVLPSMAIKLPNAC